MRVLIANIFNRAGIKRDQPIVHVHRGGVNRLLTQLRQSWRCAADDRRHEDGLAFTHAACGASRRRCFSVAQPADEVTDGRMQLCGTAFIGFYDAL
ncbi:hypothetical protein D3C81_1657910 [compost metagenome]